MQKPTTKLTNVVNPNVEDTGEFQREEWFSQIKAAAILLAYGEDVRAICTTVGWNLTLPTAKRMAHHIIQLQEHYTALTASDAQQRKEVLVDIYSYMVCAMLEESVECIDTEKTKAWDIMSRDFLGEIQAPSEYLKLIDMLGVTDYLKVKQWETLG